MDLETENRIAALLMREAAELRRQAQQEGVLAYLKKPTVRGRPNSRFLSATVRGIQQANRAVEVNEMWRVRQKEVELEERLKCRSRDERSYSSRETGCVESQRRKRHDGDTPCSSRRVDERIHASRDSDKEDSHNRVKRRDSDTPSLSSRSSYNNHDSRDDISLKDEEIDQFLHSRVKRGRGLIGSRMDEAGPYLPRSLESDGGLFANGGPVKDEGRHRSVIGPEKPSFLKPYESSGDDSDDDRRKRSKKSSSGGARKDRSRKHKSKEKSRDKKRKKEKRRKH